MLRAQLERYRRLELRVAELERRLGSESTTSGMPPSKDPIGARERRKAERKARQSSERERRKDRKRGGQPGHPGTGLSRAPDPDEREEVPPPTECSRCGTCLDPARRAGTWRMRDPGHRPDRAQLINDLRDPQPAPELRDHRQRPQPLFQHPDHRDLRPRPPTPPASP